MAIFVRTGLDQIKISWAAVIWAIALLDLLAMPARAEYGSAVILMYHRFGAAATPSTNIRLDQFDAHLEALATGGYTVLPVPEIVVRLKKGDKLPDFAVGITIDDAHVSVYREAWPRLRRAGFPFTLFVATDPIDAGHANTMNWDEIRELSRSGVTIGNHGAAHQHMLNLSKAENLENIQRASRRIEEETSTKPTLFAYPYGEFDRDLRDRIRGNEFEAAFGQHSGVVHAQSDYFGLPRFALNEQFADIDRFSLITRTLPLPVTEVTPTDPLLAINPPLFGFTVTKQLANLSGIACYASAGGEVATERLGIRRVEVRFSEPFPSGRARVNCTLRDAGGRWRWFGAQFVVPE